MIRLLLIAVILTAAFGQPNPTSSPPEYFEYMQGYGLGGNRTLTWKDGVLVTGGQILEKGRHVVVEQYEPSSQAWEQFWKTLDASNVWKWKAEYPSAVNMADGEGWSVEIRHAGRSVKSRGYNNQPPEFGAFRDAVAELIKNAKRKQPAMNDATR